MDETLQLPAQRHETLHHDTTMKSHLIRTLFLTGLSFTFLSLHAQIPGAVPENSTTTTVVTTAIPDGTATSVRTVNANEASNQLLRNPEELFRRLDANADGILSMTEFQRVSALADGATEGRPTPVPGSTAAPMPSADTRVSPAPATGTAPGTNLGTPVTR